MTYKLNNCAMPGCIEYTDKGKRLCAHHAASGKSLRVPKYVLSIGLTKIYNTIQKQKEDFSVESTMKILDADYKDHPNVVNNLNAMAKLFRTLRANSYIIKKGHVGGFVVYTMGTGWDKSNVIIDDNNKIEKKQKVYDHKETFQKLWNSLEEKDKVITKISKQITKQDKVITELEKNNIELKKNIANLENKLNTCIKVIIDERITLKKEIIEIYTKLDSINLKDTCPIAKLREQMHGSLGGKKTEK